MTSYKNNKEIVKIDHHKIWDEVGTVYQRGFKIKEELLDKFRDVLNCECIMEKNAYRKGWLSIPFEQEGKRYFMNLTQNGEVCVGWNNLAYTEKTWDNLEVGDILINDDKYERKVLSVSDEMIFYSQVGDHNKFSDHCTRKQLQSFGWKIKNAEESDEVEVNCEGQTHTISRKSAIALNILKE